MSCGVLQCLIIADACSAKILKKAPEYRGFFPFSLPLTQIPQFMPKQLTYTVDEEDDLFIARYIELDIATDGLTKDEAIENLKDALDCFFANPDQRLEQALGDTSDDE